MSMRLSWLANAYTRSLFSADDFDP